jgi:flagellar protein FlaG
MTMNKIDQIPSTVEAAGMIRAEAGGAASPTMDAKVILQSTFKTKDQTTKTGDQTAQTNTDLLEKQLEQLQRELSSQNISLKYTFDKETDSVIVSVVDSDNKKVIRQIPPEEMIALRKRMQALIGAIFDKKA